jgi:hypothetical protein
MPGASQRPDFLSRVIPADGCIFGNGTYFSSDPAYVVNKRKEGQGKLCLMVAFLITPLPSPPVECSSRHRSF